VRNLRLAWSLLRGAGGREAIRLTAMVLGVAVALWAVLIGLAAPRVAEHAHQVAVNRSPVLNSSDTRAVGPHMRSVSVTVSGRAWTQVTVSGATVTSPLPPGLRAWPHPGLSVPSPALRRLTATNPRVAALAGPLSTQTIAQKGLTGPDELYSYSADSVVSTAVHAPGQADAAPSVVVGYGNAAMVGKGGLSLSLIVETVLLVLLPAWIFLLGALRLSAASRGRRSFALVLAGMSPTRSASLYAGEMSIVAVAGFAVGAGAYELTQSAVGASGIFGMYWWPSEGRLGWVWLVAAMVVTVTVVRTVARRSMRAVAARSRSHRSGSRHRLAAMSALTLGIPSVGFLSVVNLEGWLRPSTAWASDPYTIMILVAVVAGVAAVIVGAPGIIALLGEKLAESSWPAAALGLRGASFRVPVVRRMVAFVAAAVMLSGLSTAFLAGLYRAGFGDPSQRQISVDLSAVRQYPNWLAGLPTAGRTIETTLKGSEGSYDVVIGDCPAVERKTADAYTRRSTCRDVVQRGNSGLGAPAATSITVSGHVIGVPPVPLTSYVTYDVKFPTHDAPWLSSLSQGEIDYWVSEKDGSYEAVLHALTARFPTLDIDTGVQDPDQYASYLQQVGTVDAASALGILLSIGSFLLAALESRWERTRSVATLVAVGTRAQVLRRANAVEFSFPVLVAAGPAAIVTVLGGWAVVSVEGTDNMFSPKVALWAVGGATAAILSAYVIGWATGRATFDRRALADT
jgi:hypothetical protein